jgi:hypothetical protein
MAEASARDLQSHHPATPSTTTPPSVPPTAAPTDTLCGAAWAPPPPPPPPLCVDGEGDVVLEPVGVRVACLEPPADAERDGVPDGELLAVGLADELPPSDCVPDCEPEGLGEGVGEALAAGLR